MFIILLSCGTKYKSTDNTIGGADSTNFHVKAEPSVVDSISHEYGKIRVEEIKKGKNDADFWQTGLKEVRYKIFDRDSLLTSIEIRPQDFVELYNADFSQSSKIWDSQLLDVNVERERIIVTNNFGQPESDNLTNVLCISDFNGKKEYMDSSPDCASGTNISFNKIVTCDGVYNYSQPIHEFNICCTVFADLVNSTTLFYVTDWEEIKKGAHNAFLIDIESKDTLDRFVFNDFEMILGYSALIDNNKQFGILTVLNSEDKQLITWDTLLTKRTFNLTMIESNEMLSEGARTVVMFSETLGKVIIELDDKLQPIRWNK